MSFVEALVVLVPVYLFARLIITSSTRRPYGRD